MPVSETDLHHRLNRVYDHLYGTANVRTPQGISVEVGKILHTLMFIESKQLRLFTGDGPDPVFSFSAQELRRLERCEGAICSEVAWQIRQGFERMNSAWSIYQSKDDILLRDEDIAFVCAGLSGVVVSDRQRDVFGDALEIFRGQWAKRNSGQFFTDPKVTSLALSLLQFDPRNGDDLVDLCAGTGGFLLAGLNRINHLLEIDGIRSEQMLIDLASKSLKGLEIDPSVAEVANATLGARVSRTDHRFVNEADSLQPHLPTLHASAQIKYGTHKCAATNPPFGTKTTVKNSDVLRHFELARSAGRLLNRAPDILFIEQNVNVVQPGSGLVAIVVPYQILSGPQTYFVREWILRNTQVLAVIDLPPDTFQPHTGTKASLVLLRRRKQPLASVADVEVDPIFMSVPRWIGHDRRGSPVYKVDQRGLPTSEILSDFSDVEQAYTEFLLGQDPSTKHSRSFVVPCSTVTNDPQLRLNANYYYPTETLTKLFSSERARTDWTCCKLADVTHKVFFPTRFKRNYVDWYEQAIPFLGGASISQLIVTTDKWLRHDDPKLDELRVETGWILVTRSGTTGIVSTVPEAWDGFAISEHVIRIVPNNKKLSGDYLSIYLRSRIAQDALQRGKFGSVIDEITPEYVEQLDVWIPNDSSVLNSLTQVAKRAETARNLAITSVLDAVKDLDRSLT